MRFALFALFGVVLLVPSAALAYEIPTHAYLTAETVGFYNQRFPDRVISDTSRTYLMNGSRHEDEEPRFMNHFYDPVYRRGLTYDPAIDPNYHIVKAVAWKSAKEWARNADAQGMALYAVGPRIASIFHSAQEAEWQSGETEGMALGILETDFTWEKAIRSYARGEDAKAMFILGHILHLIQDMSVPDHTRNDPHPDSPYERWTTQFTENTPDRSLGARLKDKPPLLEDSLEDHFESLALFSNNNFYSKDTIGIQSGYSVPHPTDFELLAGFLYATDLDDLGVKHLYIRRSKGGSLLLIEKHEVDLKDDLIFRDYWDRLSVRGIQQSAGVIELFFNEAEKAKNDPNFDRSEPKSRLAAALDTFGNLIVGIGDVIAGLRDARDSYFPTQGLVHLEDPGSTNVEGKVLGAVAEEQEPRAAETRQSESGAASIEEAAASVGSVVSPPTSTAVAWAAISGGSGGTSPSVSPPPPADQPHEEDGGGGGGTPPEEAPLPAIRNLVAEFSERELAMKFSWDAEEGMAYSIEELSGGTSTAVWSGIDDHRSFRIYEVGRDYHFRWTVTDALGRKNSREFTFHIPSFAEVYFYNASGDPNTPVVELRYGERPFIPELLSKGEKLWQGVGAYLNRDPNEANSALVASDPPSPGDPSGMLRIGSTGYVSIFGLRSDRCVSLGSGIERHCFVLSDEDLRLELPIANAPGEFSPEDYVTIAYYDYDIENRGPLRMLAFERVKHFFQAEPPPELPPMTPGSLDLSFDNFERVLHISWATSTDPDSPDRDLAYEWQVSSSTDLSADGWHSAGKAEGATGKSAPFTPIPGESYLVGVRARDDHGNVSAPLTQTWGFPPGYIPYVLSDWRAVASQDFARVGGEVYAIQVFTTQASLQGPNEDTFVCSIALYEIGDQGTTLLASNDTPHPGDGSSGSFQVRGYKCGAKPIFTFAGHPLLGAEKTYRWVFSLNAGNLGTVRYYGRGDNPAGGDFSDPKLKNALFTIQGQSGPLLDTR